MYQDIVDNLLETSVEDYIKNPEVDIHWDKAEIIDQFLKESQRLYGISNILLPRKAIRNHTLGKIKVRKGTRLSSPLCYLARDPAYFPNPTKFDLDRFSKENMKKLPKRIFMPFFEGHR